MIRAMLALMAGLLCTLAGMRYASTLQNEAKRLMRWEPLLGHLALILQEGTLALPQALQEAAQGHLLPDVMLRQLAGAMRTSPMQPMDALLAPLCESLTEKDVLLRMCCRLGRGTMENRVQAVQQAAQEIGLLAKDAQARAEKDVRLWQTLGLTAGICLTIFLL